MSVVHSGRVRTSEKQFLFMFALTVAIQSFHLVEHIAQVLQKFVLQVTPAHGLIGQLDLEQVHFAFNLFYLSTLFIVMVGWQYYGRDVARKHLKLFGFMLFATVVVQGYHMLEHAVKFAQFLETGMQGTPGILGMYIDGVVFHALMNTAVFLPAVAVFFGAGLHQRLTNQRYGLR